MLTLFPQTVAALVSRQKLFKIGYLMKWPKKIITYIKSPMTLLIYIMTVRRSRYELYKLRPY